MQCDVLAGLLQELQEAATDAAVTKTTTAEVATPATSDDKTAATLSHAPVVGPTAADLESIKELIQFDHEYIKTVQVQNSVNSKPAAAAAAAKKKTKPKMVSVINVSVSANQASPAKPTTPEQSDAKLDLPDFFNTEMLNLSPDLLDDLNALLGEVNTSSSNTASDCKDGKQLQQPSFVSQNNTTHKRKSSDSSSSPTKMSRVDSDLCYETIARFDDLFSPEEPVSPHSVSDLSDARSPASEISSPGLGDDMWEESFTELFPSLV